jgi:magnesium and cobalt transporter
MHGFGHLPKRGDSIELSGFVFKILQVDRRRLIQLQVTLPEQRHNNEVE